MDDDNPLPKADGGQAFPDEMSNGMSLRDWFAGMALQSIAAKGMDAKVKADLVALAVYEMADAMLKERGRT